MAALEQLYRRYYRLVRWVLRGSGVSESVLDDRVHDVFLAIHRRLPQRDPDVPLRQWITGVARNVAFSHRRTAARQRRQLEQLATPPEPPRPDEQLARRQAWQALSGFLEQLSPEQREVFVMVDITGMRVSELAASTGEPANTLHSRLRVARGRFGRHFEASDEARPGMLRRARRQAPEHEPQRRRTWAGIVAAVGGPEALVPASSLGAAGPSVAASTGTLGKIALATAAAGVLAAAAIGGTGLRSHTSSAPETAATARASIDAPTASSPTRPAAPSPDASGAPPPSPSLDAPDSSPRRPAPRPARRTTTPPSPSATTVPSSPPSDPDAAMAAALSTLRRARGHLTAGRGADALAELDRFEGDFGALERDRLRVTLDASCAAAEPTRARTAARALVARGVALDPEEPCERDAARRSAD